jgi:hypothetical protein
MAILRATLFPASTKINSPETWFAFLLVPVYFAICIGLVRATNLKRAPLALVFVVNWLVAATGFGLFATVTRMAEGDWLGVGTFSGFLAAAIGTALAAKFRNPAAKGEGTSEGARVLG